MQDHAAPQRNLASPGLTLTEHYKGFAAERGIVPGSLNAIPKPEGMSANKGIPHLGQSFVPKQEAPPVVRVCLIPTKSGEDCKAKPIRGRDYCIGHSRSLEEEVDFGSLGD